MQTSIEYANHIEIVKDLNLYKTVREIWVEPQIAQQAIAFICKRFVFSWYILMMDPDLQ